MGFEHKYPYSDFHELNLDWILGVVKRLETEWPEFKTALETEWNEYKNGLTGEGGEWPTFKTQIETTVNNLIHDVVGPYNENLDYQTGMFCYYEGKVYKCLQTSSAAFPRPFNSYNWYSYENQNTNSIVNDLFNYLTDALNDQDNEIYNWIQRTAAQWDETVAYKVGDYCSAYVGGAFIPSTWRYYKCIQNCIGINVLDTSCWKEVIFASDVAETIAAYKQAMQDQYDTFLASYQRQFGVVQTRGSSTTDVMSQKAVSDELQAIDDDIQAHDDELQEIGEQIEKIVAGDITVGKSNLANNFDSKMVLTDNSGYLYRTTGGSREVGEQNRVKKIIGASVPIVQLFTKPASGTTSINGLTIVSDGDKAVVNGTYNTDAPYDETDIFGRPSTTFEFTKDHVYLSLAPKLPNGVSGTNVIVGNTPIFGYKHSNGSTITKALETGTSYSFIRFYQVANGTVFTNYEVYYSMIDLTVTFGATVANRLYALEQAQAGTGVAKAKEILVKDRYPHNLTDFTHTKTSGKVNNGFNQWDEQYELGTYDAQTGLPLVYNDRIRTKNPIEVFSNTTYYFKTKTGLSAGNVYCYDASMNFIESYINKGNATFTTPSNCKFINVSFGSPYGATYNHDICINLHWDGERDGEYEPYQEWNYPVQDIELKGILSLDAQDNWVTDGDEYLPSGVVNDNYNENTDISALAWSYVYPVYYVRINDMEMPSSNTTTPNLRSSKYNVVARNSLDNDGDMCIDTSAGYARLFVRDTAQSGNPTGSIIYKLVTPTQTSADSYTELQNDSNWGTEKWIDTRDVPMPVFSTCEYIPDLKAKLEAAPESPEEDGDYIMHRENGINSYGSLATWLPANGYNKLVSITGYDATKTQTLKNVQGVFNWVDDQ